MDDHMQLANDAIGVLIWIAIMVIAGIFNFVKKMRENSDNAEWEAEWDDTPPSTPGTQQREWVDEASQATEERIAQERAEREARVREIRERQARAEAEAARAEREQEVTSSMPFDPMGDMRQQMETLIDRQQAIAERQHRAEEEAERAAQWLAAQSAATPQVPDFQSMEAMPSMPEASSVDMSAVRKRKTWANSMKKKDLQRAFIMSEVFDRPRCYDT